MKTKRFHKGDIVAYLEIPEEEGYLKRALCPLFYIGHNVLLTTKFKLVKRPFFNWFKQ